MAQEVLSHRKVIVEDPIEMTNLSASHVGPAKSLEATAKTCLQDVRKERHGRRSRRLRRESNLLQSVGASSLQDGTMDRLVHCYPRYRKCMMCYPASLLCPLCYLFCTQVNFTIVSLIFIFACLASPLLSLSTSTVTEFDPGSSCQCTPDASVWIWKGGHRR